MASGPFLERPFWYFEGPIRIPCKPLDILSQHLRPPQGPTRIPLEPHNIHKELQPLPGNNPSWTQNTQPFSPINPYPMPCPGLGCCCKWHCSCSVWNDITKSPLNPYQIVRSMICSNPRTWEMCKWSASTNSATHQTRVSRVKFTSIATTCSNLTCSGEEKMWT